MKKLISQTKSFALSKLYRLLYAINPRYSAELMYHHAFHKPMDLKNPQDLIEKINWMQFYSDTSMWTLCADKFRMREYVAAKGLENNLPKLYGHWENPYDIDFSSLPDEFVLKSNNGCGTVMIVKNKTQLNEPETKARLKTWLKPYGYTGGQTHYLRIKPCIIAEELLHQNEAEKAFSPKSIVDYKIWCINGKPESVFVAFNRQNALQINIALFDTEWKALPQYLHSTKLDVYDPRYVIPKPKSLASMLEMASKLAEPFPEVRVDFYEIGEKPVIGELTFTTGYGYFTYDYYLILGNKLDISKLQWGGVRIVVVRVYNQAIHGVALKAPLYGLAA